MNTDNLPAAPTGTAAAAMSSMEIAEITGKRHDNVLADIRAMLNDLGVAALTFQGSYIGKDGTARPCYFLPEEEMLTLVSGYRVDLRRAIIARWKALEAGTATPMRIELADPAVLTGVLDHLHEKVAAQKAQLEAQAPKVAAFERLSASEGAYTITDAARELGMAQRTFFKWLINNGWVFRERRTNRPIPYADKRKDGLMEVVASTVWVHGVEVAVQSTYITRKGLNTIAETLGIKLWP
ncbi:phage regulatory protein/antirepressor Ant [Paenirhodobacter sp.]|uniref:phage regulatory protein/antirepressor Ant n=1 Tax=Paenirhodobacter sp. TaxID=1965326 RepID=UPI003B50E8D6